MHGLNTWTLHERRNSGDKKHLIHCKFCKFSHLQRIEWSVIFRLQLWDEDTDLLAIFQLVGLLPGLPWPLQELEMLLKAPATTHLQCSYWGKEVVAQNPTVLGPSTLCIRWSSPVPSSGPSRWLLVNFKQAWACDGLPRGTLCTLQDFNQWLHCV